MVNAVKRLTCFALLLCLLTICARAVPETDGAIGRVEYANHRQIIYPSHESNNHVAVAYLYWDISRVDYSVYVGVKYYCDDLSKLLEAEAAATEKHRDETEPAPVVQTGVELTVNGDVCVTAMQDGTLVGLDENRYDAESRFTFIRNDVGKPDTNTLTCEIRLGLKYWIPYDAVLGVRILDFSGLPSNLYTVILNPAPTAAASANAAEPTATTAAPQNTTATTAESRRDVSGVTRRVITAASGVAKASGKAAETSASETRSTAAPSTKTAKTPQNKTRSAIKAAASTTRPPSQTSAKADGDPASTTAPRTAADRSDPSKTVSDTAAKAQRTAWLGKAKTIGVALASVLLTAAVMTAVFAGLRRKSVPENDPRNDANPNAAHDSEDRASEDVF